jgi:hypothetical protein
VKGDDFLPQFGLAVRKSSLCRKYDHIGRFSKKQSMPVTKGFNAIKKVFILKVKKYPIGFV